MKTQLNEIKRMQQLAGVITESQLNEAKSLLPLDANKLKDILIKASQTNAQHSEDVLFPKRYIKPYFQDLSIIQKVLQDGPAKFKGHIEDTLSPLSTKEYNFEGSFGPWTQLDFALDFSRAIYEYEYDDLLSWWNNLVKIVNNFEL